MLDVDFGDLIDYFGMDPATGSIMLYIESLKDVREFMSAARHFAKNKPIIVVKSGRFARSAKAAASHTGALAGDDNFYDAAFKRAGAIRVLEIEDLFGCSAALAVQTRPHGPRLAIITNAGGPGVLAADRLIDKGGVIAELSDETVEALDKVLPPFWSRENPVDILGDDDRSRRCCKTRFRGRQWEYATLQAASCVVDGCRRSGVRKRHPRTKRHPEFRNT
jgi:acetyltransferase